MTIEEVENKILQIEERPKENKEAYISNFKAAKKIIKNKAQELKYKIGYDFPQLLRIMDKGGYTKVAEFRPNNVTYYYSKTFKKRLLNKVNNKALVKYLEGKQSLK